MPLISVIVNAYNGAETLDETLTSILNQSYRSLELIVWNDASTDTTSAIVSALNDSRIRYFESSQNLGLAKARARALREARGDWVAFLDQDDLWHEDHLLRAISALDDLSDVGFVYARTLRFSASGMQVDYDHRHEYEALPSGYIFQDLLRDSCFIAMGSVVFQRAILDKVGDLPQSIDACPDYYLYLKIAHEHQVAAVQEIGCYYRMHDKNMTKTYGASMQREILWLLDLWKPLISDDLYRLRRKVHGSNLAVCELRQEKKPLSALKWLLRNGSLFYLLTRPVAIIWRKVKRQVVTPYWCQKHNQHTQVMGTRVSAFTYSQAVDYVESMVRDAKGGYVSCANAFGLSLASGDSAYQSILSKAAMVTTDGMPVVWLLRALAYACDRVHNDDLVLSLCDRNRGWRVVLVGGRDGQPELVAQALIERFPGISIVAAFPTPVRPVPVGVTEEIIASIRDLEPDVVWVGMGTPAQDVWMSEVNGACAAPMVACGSLFDLLAGETRPAPQWIKKMGLQWLFRLALEPRRLAMRYLKHNTRFIILALRELFAKS